MHKTIREALDYLDSLTTLTKGKQPDTLIGITPSFPALYSCHQKLEELHSPIWLGAQNVHQEPQGAFTGETSLPMLMEAGVRFVLIGHSERRHIFQENDELIAKKMHAVSSAGLIPVLCIGETLEEKQEQKTEEVLAKQLKTGLSLLSPSTPFFLAYEPVWAIGTGKVASVEDVQNMHAFCRRVMQDLFTEESSASTPILYGGSVKVENAKEILELPDVNGVLVGGASLDPHTFSQIVLC